MSKIYPQIAIFTIARDFHSWAIRHALASRGFHCSIIETDGLAGSGGMSWSTSDEIDRSVIHDLDGNIVSIKDLSLIWWRRVNGVPRVPEYIQDEAMRDLVINDCRATLFGLVSTEFQGRWINHPEASRVAENKLVQLKTAQKAGLRLPRTLISQDSQTVRRFCHELDYRVIVKVVAGTSKTPIMTGLVTPQILADESICLSPAIYQELIPGNYHLRICCFGEDIHTVLLKTDRLDWRYPLDVVAEPYELDEKTAYRLRSIVKNLGLRMGIIDMKLASNGEPVWLEINPQGQFLFLEGICGIPLTEIFTQFLMNEAEPTILK